jgi:NADH-quinone oxidoreductase subunit L
VLVFTAILTSFYMVRMWKLVFLGEARGEGAGHAHENGLLITLPLVVLAALSIVGGYAKHYPAAYADVLVHIPEAHGTAHSIVLATSLLVLLIGAGAALILYRPAAQDSLAQRAPGVFGGLTVLQGSFDRAYGYYIAKVQQRFAMVLNFIDEVLISGLIIRGTAGMVGLLGLGARALHVGNVNAYAYWFLLGLVALWAFVTGWALF